MSEQPDSPQPPAAKRVLTERIHHGDTVIDEYAWLTAKDDQETIAFLEAENSFTAAITARQDGLREAIFTEIKTRTKETDLSVPTRKGSWWYYARTIEGQQYAVHCRRAVRPDDEGPPISAVGALDVSPDGHLLAYSTDFDGDERYTMRFRDLRTGETALDEIPDTYYGSAWSADATALFYITVDEAWRPYRVWRHIIGTPAS